MERVAALAHELANQLVSVYAGLSLLQEKRQQAEPSQIDAMLADLRRGREIVSEILEASRGSAQKATALRDVLDRVVERFRAEKPRVAIDVDAPIVGEVMANAAQLDRLVSSVLAAERSALRLAPSRARVRIDLTHRDHRIRLTVRTASAAPKSVELEKLFKLTVLKNPPAWGGELGFGVCGAIARAHGGSFALRVGERGGRVYELELPSLLAEASPPERPARDGALRLLVVDDEARVRESLRMILEHLGHSFDVAASGAEALERLDSTNYDGLLLDYRLGGMVDGAELVAEVERRHPELLDRTIIATGDPSRLEVVDLVTRAHVRLLAKPFGVEEVRAAIAPFVSMDRARPA